MAAGENALLAQIQNGELSAIADYGLKRSGGDKTHHSLSRLR
jgi:hypothetical protein